MTDLQHILDEIGAEMATMEARGRVADYIPELARIDPGKFGMAVALPDGTVLKTGDADEGFSIQSISKAFTLAIALGRLGDQLWSRVGREPSGQRFNSIVQLEYERGRPRNPFINAGAISVTDAILEGRAPSTLLCEIVDFIKLAADDESIFINESVARSERQTGHRNYALAHFMRDHGILHHDPDLTLGAYFHQCAVEMSCVQLARAGLFLTSTSGATPIIAPHHVRRICAIMMTCGHYDASGEFAFQVGLPGKSGVGGGILVIAPGRASIAIWSPGLNENGNSKLGSLAARRLAEMTGWSVFSGKHLAD